MLKGEADRLRATLEAHKKLEQQQVPAPVVNPSMEHTPVDLVFDPIEKYAWDQEGNFVKLYVSLDNIGSIDKSNITCTFEERGFNLAIVGYQKKNLRLHFTNLQGDIVPESSRHLHKSNMVIVKLRTAESKKWSDLLTKKAEPQEEGR